MVYFLALTEVEILFVFFQKQKDCNERQENGLSKKPEPFASNLKNDKKKSRFASRLDCIVVEILNFSNDFIR
jgi:hypothetical protein